LLFVEVEGGCTGGLLVGVEGIEGFFAPDSVSLGMTVETTDTEDFVPAFLGNRVVENDVAVC
jgi:hypothetical protein